jgi:hypothetical protein
MSGVITISAIISAIIGTFFLHKWRHTPWPEAYTIKKGSHFANLLHRFVIPLTFNVASRRMRWEIIFGKGCDYIDNNAGDINKLCGVSYGLDNHWRSVRIGWNYSRANNMIQLFSYVYVKGIRKEHYLCDVPLYEEIIVCLDHLPETEQVVIQIYDAQGHHMPLGPLETTSWIVQGIDKSWIRIKQYPYYGGNKPAPNDMTIYVMES